MPEHCPCHDSDQQIININFVPSAHRWMILISTDLQYFSRLRYIYSKRVNKPRLIESANSSNLYFIQAGAQDYIGSFSPFGHHEDCLGPPSGASKVMCRSLYTIHVLIIAPDVTPLCFLCIMWSLDVRLLQLCPVQSLRTLRSCRLRA